MSLKKNCILFLLVCLLSFSASAQDISKGVYLTEAEFQNLLSIITQSKANSEAQMKLIAELKAALQTQESALNEALSSLALSETELTELKTTLLSIQDYSAKLNAYCETLESENRNLKTRNKIFGAGFGATGVGFVIVLFILLL